MANEQEALNLVTTALLQQQKQSNKRMFILLLVSLIFNVLIVTGFLIYESQWEYTTETVTETVTVDQQQSEGGGNNVFQTGEYASYTVTAE